MNDNLYHESLARKNGYVLIAGVDEAGRGPLAGPVVAAAVIIPEDIRLEGVKDSKMMTEKARNRAFSVINAEAAAVGIGVVSSNLIDKINILNASLEAMKRAVLSLELPPDFILVDGIHRIPTIIPQKCIKKGDRLSQSISAASIMAKVYRDRIMDSYHERFPQYAFQQNKGYGTEEHRKALLRYGPTVIHRFSFKGVESK
ncbi:MAG: ribonuclease HII [Deltaproteobacteria bacterium]|nr:ribonuclease HII [Deltaproteobacteria bacterium]